MLLDGTKNDARAPPYPFDMGTADDSIREVLATNTRTLMERRGWKQIQLAAKSGISQTHIGNVLRREVEPTSKIIAGLARAFGVPAYLLLVPGLPPEILDSREVPNLLQSYLEAAAQPLSAVIARRHARKS